MIFMVDDHMAERTELPPAIPTFPPRTTAMTFSPIPLFPTIPCRDFSLPRRVDVDLRIRLRR